jgi:hypothetical protein
MLTRNSQVGEFYVLQPPQVDPTDGDIANKGKGKFTCDALIYDEESDRHVRITWEQALKACCIKDNEVAPATNLSHPTKMMMTSAIPGDQKSLKGWKDKADEWTAFNNGTGDVAYSQLDTDIRIVIARPFIEHLMHSVIMAVSGRDTGATLFGPADMQLSANTQVKTIEGACCARARTHSALHPWWPSPPPAAERTNRGAQATTRATSRPSSPSPRTCL